MNKFKHGHQIKVLMLVNRLSAQAKWNELNSGLKIFNKIITRYYIDQYFKLVFQVASLKFPHSIDAMPQFIDRNCFKLGINLLQMYHLTNSLEEPETSILISMLNPNLDYIKWREAIKIDSESTKYDNQLAKQLAENCSYQFQNLIDSLDIADLQIKKLSEIYIYYSKINELQDILEKYSDSHQDYLNAQKYLLELEINHLNTLSIKSFQKIVKLCQSDSYILKYCKYFNDDSLCIDSYFDMLDYAKWRYNLKLWKAFNKALLKPERTQAIKECITENWNLRKDYWIPYHFEAFTEKYMPIDLNRLSIGIILLGGENEFIKKLIQLNKLKLNDFEKETLTHGWLNSE